MRHLALWARSAFNPDKAYTATGLGDRIHACTVAWCYGAPVTLHVTGEQYSGGQFNNKPESWAEICELFPEGADTIQPHSVRGLTDAQWQVHLGPDVQMYHYVDFDIGQTRPLDISQYLKDIPLLQPKRQYIELPAEYITAQWDTSAGRTIANPGRIQDKYGLPVVVIGGQARSYDLRWSLMHIAYVLAHAQMHIGADSAFMHMAQLYLPPERIHIYTQSQTHHVKRAVARGAKLNPYA